MSNGIFEEEFSSNRPDHGSGLVVVKDGSVNGGDANYLYQGTVPAVSGQFSSKFRVSMWKPGNTNVTGLDNYELNTNGEINYERGSISLIGSVVGAPHIQIKLTGRKITPAV